MSVRLEDLSQAFTRLGSYCHLTGVTTCVAGRGRGPCSLFKFLWWIWSLLQILKDAKRTQVPNRLPSLLFLWDHIVGRPVFVGADPFSRVPTCSRICTPVLAPAHPFSHHMSIEWDPQIHAPVDDMMLSLLEVPSPLVYQPSRLLH